MRWIIYTSFMNARTDDLFMKRAHILFFCLYITSLLSVLPVRCPPEWKWRGRRDDLRDFLSHRPLSSLSSLSSPHLTWGYQCGKCQMQEAEDLINKWYSPRDFKNKMTFQKCVCVCVYRCICVYLCVFVYVRICVYVWLAVFDWDAIATSHEISGEVCVHLALSMTYLKYSYD